MTETEILSVLVENLPFLKAVIVVMLICMLSDSVCNAIRLLKKKED